MSAFGVTSRFNVYLNGEIAPLTRLGRERTGDGLLHHGMEILELRPHPRELHNVRAIATEFAPQVEREWTSKFHTGTAHSPPLRSQAKIKAPREEEASTYFLIDKNFSTTPSGSLQKKILEPCIGPLGTVAGEGEHITVPCDLSFS